MSTSRIKATLSLLQKQKPRWPDPELSIGKFRGVKKGKYNCWEAEGPAKEAFEDIKPQIKLLLEELCVPVPSSSFILFDIFMIGETESTAVPHIMFSCKHQKSRKAAVKVVEQSDILQQCPPGIHFGHWDYPPHLKDLRFLSSSTSYSFPPRRTDNHDYGIIPIFDPYKPETVQAMQLRLKETCGVSETYRTATIGGVVELSGKRFYVAPAHVFSNHDQDRPSDGICLDPDDSDCEFGGFDNMNDNTPGDHEAEFMSQYSVTPESSDAEDEWDFYDDHFSDVDSEGSSPEDNGIPSVITKDFEEAWCLSGKPESVTQFSSGTVHDSTKLNTLDYCLLEIDDGDKFSLYLPVLSMRSVGRPGPGATNVTAFTGSGTLLAGVLSDRRTCIRLPHTTGYTEVLSVEFQHSLRPGDSGSIVRDASTGMIYGHVVAGDTGSQTAFIIPADDMVYDLMASTGDGWTLPIDYKIISPLLQDLLTPEEQSLPFQHEIDFDLAWHPDIASVHQWMCEHIGSLWPIGKPGSGKSTRLQHSSIITAGRSLDGGTWNDPLLDSYPQDTYQSLLWWPSAVFPDVSDLSISLPGSGIRELLDSLDSFSRILDTIRDTYLDPDIRRGNLSRAVLLNMMHSKAVSIKRFPPSQRLFELEDEIRGRVCGRCIDSGEPMSNLPKAGPEWKWKMVLRVLALISQDSTTINLHSAPFDIGSPIILDTPWMTAVPPQNSTDIIHYRRAMRTDPVHILLAAFLSSLPRTFNRQQRACRNAGKCPIAGQCRQLAMNVPLSDVSATDSWFSTICSRGQDISDWVELSSISFAVPLPGIHDTLHPGARYFLHGLRVSTDLTYETYLMSSGFRILGSLHSEEPVLVKKKSPQCCHCNGTFHRRMTVLHRLGESPIVNQSLRKLTK